MMNNYIRPKSYYGNFTEKETRDELAVTVFDFRKQSQLSKWLSKPLDAESSRDFTLPGNPWRRRLYVRSHRSAFISAWTCARGGLLD